jgi:DNA repair protein RadA/Sms
MLVEVQALVTKSELNHARRVAIGLDSRRLTLMLGVISRHASADFAGKDVFAAAAGGLSVKEPAADLALCLATLSTYRDVALDPEVVAVGEVGLGGEIRKVPGAERRLSEAARLGFRSALVPKGQGSHPGIDTREVTELPQAFGFATLSLTTYASQSSA